MAAGAGRTALMLAANYNHPAVVAALLKSGATVNTKDASGWTALLFAANQGSLDCARLLVEGGADLHAQTFFGKTALHLASAAGHAAVVTYLLDRTGSPDSKVATHGRTPLMAAVRHGREDVAEVLLARGANPNLGDRAGNTALMSAASRGSLLLVRSLLERGARPNAVRLDGRTALHLASGYNYPEVVRALVAAGARATALDAMGLTPLMHAAQRGNTTIVSMLARRRSYVEHENVHGQTALLLAIANNHIDTVRVLLGLGARLNRGNRYGSTPLMWAVSHDHEGIVELLTERGANPQARDEDGLSAVLLARVANNRRMQTLLAPVGCLREQPPAKSHKVVSTSGRASYARLMSQPSAPCPFEPLPPVRERGMLTAEARIWIERTQQENQALQKQSESGNLPGEVILEQESNESGATAQKHTNRLWHDPQYHPSQPGLVRLQQLRRSHANNAYRLALSAFQSGTSALKKADWRIQEHYMRNAAQVQLNEGSFVRWQARRQLLERKVESIRQRGHANAAVYFERGLAHLARIRNAEARSSMPYRSLARLTRRKLAISLYHLERFEQCVVILEQMLAGERAGDFPVHRYLVECYNGLERIAVRLGSQQEIRFFREKKNAHLVRYARLAFGAETDQFRAAVDAANEDGTLGLLD